MLLSPVYFAVRRLLRLLTRGSEHGEVAREIEILVLRHQARVLSRGRRMPLRCLDRVLLAAAGSLLRRDRWRAFAVSPPTLLHWHRELVRRKWTYRRRRRLGRPRAGGETAALILRLAKENPRWGYRRIQGEVRKLGVVISATAIRSVLLRHGLTPAPRRYPRLRLLPQHPRLRLLPQPPRLRVLAQPPRLRLLPQPPRLRVLARQRLCLRILTRYSPSFPDNVGSLACGTHSLCGPFRGVALYSRIGLLRRRRKGAGPPALLDTSARKPLQTGMMRAPASSSRAARRFSPSSSMPAW
jgi:transposase